MDINTTQMDSIRKRESLTQIIENSGVDSGMDAGMTTYPSAQ